MAEIGTEIRILSLTKDGLKSIVREVVQAEVTQALKTELAKILTTPEEDRLVPRSEAMALLGVKSRDTMIKFERGGDLDPVRMAGNRVSYSLENIREFKQKRA